MSSGSRRGQLGGAAEDDLLVDPAPGSRPTARLGRLRSAPGRAVLVEALVEQLGEAAELGLEASSAKAGPTAAQLDQEEARGRRVGGEPLERRRERLAHPLRPRRPARCRRPGPRSSRSSSEDPVGGEHAVELVVEEFVEALAADARPRRGCRRRWSPRSPWPTVTRTTAASRRSRCERLDQLPRQAVPAARQPPLAQVLGLVAHRSAAPSVSVSRAQAGLLERLLVAAEGADRQVDDLGQQLGQAVGLAGGDLVEDQHLGPAEGEARVGVRLPGSPPSAPRALRAPGSVSSAVALDHRRFDRDRVAGQQLGQRRACAASARGPRSPPCEPPRPGGSAGEWAARGDRLQLARGSASRAASKQARLSSKCL